MRNKQGLLRWSFVLSLVFAVQLAGCANKSENAEKSAEGKSNTGKSEQGPQAAKKSAKERLIGTWDMSVAFDGDAAFAFLTSKGVPADKIPAQAAGMKAEIEKTKVTREWSSDGSTTETIIHASGMKEVHDVQWEVVSESGDVIEVKLGSDNDAPPRTIEMTFQDNDTYLLTKEPQFEGMPFKTPVFTRKK